MISITTSTFTQKIEVIERPDSVQIKIGLSIGYKLIFAIAVFEVFIWGFSFFYSQSYGSGIIGSIMLAIFIIGAFITEKKKITVNPETRKLRVVTWSDNKPIRWTSDMKLNYERLFNDSEKLIGIRLYLIDFDGHENDVTLFSTEKGFRKFVYVYNQKFTSFKLEII